MATLAVARGAALARFYARQALNVRASVTPHDTFMTPPPYRKTSKVEVYQLSCGAILQGVSEEIPSICLRVENGATPLNEQENVQTNTSLTSSQKAMASLWEQHLRDEFELHDVDKTMETMVADPYNTAIPVMTGGVGGDGVREFYTKWFISQNPPDIETTLVSRTIGNNQLVDELILKFTHTTQMDWILPGIPPTGKWVEVPLVVVVGFRDGKIAHEHVYWDQASVLVQVGLLDPGTLPVVGIESAQKVLNPDLPSNTLIERAYQRK